MRVLIIIFALIFCVFYGCADKRAGWGSEWGGSCVGRGCEWDAKANAIISYARVVEVDGQLLRQDLELLLDDGRIFAVYDYTDRQAYRIGDRVRIEYSGRRARKVQKIGVIYEDWQNLYDP